MLNFRDEDSRCCGQTLWGAGPEDRSAGVAWDWVEIVEGVVAMADPMSVVTNLRLINANGEALGAQELAVQLHQMVYALPWQTEVHRVLHPNA